jgi:hypothetical protein
MGLKNSPYNCIQGILFAKELIRGNPAEARNIFHWDEVRMNLPGGPTYKPWLPRVSKIRWSDRHLACNFVTYVDDTRIAGSSWDEARSTGRRVASTLNWLGLQDALRKR